MRNPTGVRTESTGSPNASRAGALHSHIHSHRHNRSRSPIHASPGSARPGFDFRGRPLSAGDGWAAGAAIGGVL